jgi:predicted GIY-YIG superfamily endonuclease
MKEEFTVYVLRSIFDGSRYIGMTSKSPEERLIDHNGGSNQYTKGHRPYKLVYFEKGYCKSCALNRERFLKSGIGRQILAKIENKGD